MEVLEIIKSRGYRSGSSARTRTAVAEAVSCERLIWARGDIRGLWEWAKLINQCCALHHLRQVEVCGLEIAVAIRQPVSEILDLARHHHAAGLLSLLMERCFQLACVSVVFCPHAIDIAVGFAATLLLREAVLSKLTSERIVALHDRFLKPCLTLEHGGVERKC